MPIYRQGLTAGGKVRIERNCWLSFGSAVICTSGELVLGRNSVVGANAVVTRSVPPYSVVVGNPARIIRRFDPETRKWVRSRRRLILSYSKPPAISAIGASEFEYTMSK